MENAKKMTSKANLVEDGSNKDKQKSFKPKHRNQNFKKYDKKSYFQKIRILRRKRVLAVFVENQDTMLPNVGSKRLTML